MEFPDPGECLRRTVHRTRKPIAQNHQSGDLVRGADAPVLSGHMQGRILSMIAQMLQPKDTVGNLHRLFGALHGWGSRQTADCTRSM